MSPAGANARQRNERSSADAFAALRRRDGAALLVPVALVVRDFRVRTGAAERARGRNVCLEHHVSIFAAYLRLLPGRRLACLAADRCLVAATHLRLRGDARAPDGAYLPRRPYDSITCAQ